MCTWDWARKRTYTRSRSSGFGPEGSVRDVGLPSPVTHTLWAAMTFHKASRRHHQPRCSKQPQRYVDLSS